MQHGRAEDMEGLDGYAALLREKGHKATVLTNNSQEMRDIRVKAARFTFKQCEKDGKVPSTEELDPNVVEFSHIKDGYQYYGGFQFLLSIAEHMCKKRVG